MSDSQRALLGFSFFLVIFGLTQGVLIFQDTNPTLSLIFFGLVFLSILSPYWLSYLFKRYKTWQTDKQIKKVNTHIENTCKREVLTEKVPHFNRELDRLAKMRINKLLGF